MKKSHWIVAGGLAVSLHAGAFYGVFLHNQDKSGSLAAGEQGVEFDLGMLGDMGVKQKTVMAQAEMSPEPEVEPEPEIEPEPEVKPEPEVEPEPEIKPEPENKPEPKPIPKPEPKVEVKQKSEIIAPRSEPKPKPKPEPKPKPVVSKQVTADKTVVQQKATTGRAKAASNGGTAAAKADYYAKLAAKLASNKRYPRASRRRGEQGIVTVSFTAFPNGDARRIAITQSSGSKRLDKAAIEMVKRSQPLPAFTLEMGSEPLDITLPVQFQLRD